MGAAVAVPSATLAIALTSSADVVMARERTMLTHDFLLDFQSTGFEQWRLLCATGLGKQASGKATPDITEQFVCLPSSKSTLDNPPPGGAFHEAGFPRSQNILAPGVKKPTAAPGAGIMGKG
ncbi:hypothetical protein Pelo_6326 [Pelomyxa schiedti]|nr:hypothetical protein Pelo_6326 [Pelomyxa schiedti]